MASNSTLLLLLLSFQLFITTSLCQPQQSSDRDLAGLIKIRQQFGDPAGVFPGWQPNTSCASWWPAACNAQGRVTKLFLDNLVGINSPLPPAIGELEMLDTLSITGIPGLHGPIPDSFGNLRHLSVLSTSWSPTSPGRSRRRCPAPTSPPSTSSGTGSTAASRDRCRGCRTCPSFVASYNDLAGTIPPFLLVRSTAPGAPAGLRLDGNRLSGTIPWTYAFERNWMEFTVAGNRLTGDASFLFGGHKTNGNIDLSGNRFRFNLTGLEMPMDLIFLNLSRNRLYGGVPASLRSSRVAVLDLSYNELFGEIPTGGHMTQFKAAAYKHNKCLCGTPLPPCANGH